MKIVFFCKTSEIKFLTSIIDRMSQRHEVQVSEGSDRDELIRHMRWADVAWFEWCDDHVRQASAFARRQYDCSVVCRIHRYEVFTSKIQLTNWSSVDMVIFVSPHIRDVFMKRTSLRPSTTVIHNGLDMTRFSPGSNTRPRGKKIASIAHLWKKKNPMLALYCLKQIHAYDPGYSLHMVGLHRDQEVIEYVDNYLRHNPLPVHIHGYVDDIPRWLLDKDYILSTSLSESFQYGLAEGMASGLLPLIHNWPGAAELYPDRFIFNDPLECLALLQRLEKADRGDLVDENRAFLQERYDLDQQLEKIETLLLDLADPAHEDMEAPDLVSTGDALYGSKDWSGAYRAYSGALHVPDHSLPRWSLLDKLAMCCWHLRSFQEGAELCQELLDMQDLPSGQRVRIEDNLDWHRRRLAETR